MTTTETSLIPDTDLTDWSDALLSVLQALGFASVTAYADSRPTRSLLSMAEELRLPSVSARGLERALIEEAEQAGTMDRCARGLLARDLLTELPDGWPSADDGDATRLIQRASAFASVAFALPPSYAPALQRIRRSMEIADIPSGWRPDGPDDPLLIDVFAEHWDLIPGAAQPV
jgi:hypothetical protein